MELFRQSLNKGLLEKEHMQSLFKDPNTRIYNLSPGLHVIHFLAAVAKLTEKFRVNLYFETSQHSVQTADDNISDTSEALQLTLVLYIFKLVLLSVIKNK